MLDVRKDFPLLERHPKLLYLDSACTSLKPKAVIEAEMSYYTGLGACGGRSSHRLGRKTGEMVDSAREKVAKFIRADADGLVWTRNATEALNLVANALDYSKRRKVVTTTMEHHSVLLPFMKLRDRGAIRLEMLPCDDVGKVGLDKWAAAADRETALLVTHNWNNTTGTGQDSERIAKIAHDCGALACIDGAQGVPHHKADCRNLDFLCFSAHKMLGPTGIGALVTKKEHLRMLNPLVIGGGSVKSVSIDNVVPLDGFAGFEAGVQHYAGIAGFAAACDYLDRMGMDNVEAHEKALAEAMLKALEGAEANVLGPKTSERHGALFSFNFKNAKAHDVALMLDKEDIALRSGFFCAQPAMEALGAKDGAARASGYVYNNLEDVKRFGDALIRIKQLYD